MRSALLALVLTSAVSFMAHADDALPIDKSNPTPVEGTDLIQKAQWEQTAYGVIANVCQTPYRYCFIPGMVLVGTPCNCYGEAGQIAAE